MRVKKYISAQLNELIRKYKGVTDASAIVFNRRMPHVDVAVSDENMKRLLSHVKMSWEQLGQEKPHFSVLTSTNFLPENFSENEEKFWESGNRDLNIIQELCLSSGVSLEGVTRCLEYGCGVGRVTVKLAEQFPQVLGLDISQPHLDLAKRRAIDLGLNNITYDQIDLDYLNELHEYDFLYSRIVLQHNPPPIMKYVLEKLLGKLSKGGVAIFQIPVYMRDYTFVVETYLSEVEPQMEMHCLPQAEIFNLIHAVGGQVMQVRETGDIGNYGSWVSNMFVVTK